MGLSERKKEIIRIPGSVLVQAGPGAGKTKTLVARAEHIYTVTQKRVALLSYTNAAADEIKIRINNDYPIYVGTIHSFCLKYILRPFLWLKNWPRFKVVPYAVLKEFTDEYSEELRSVYDKFQLIESLNKDLDGTYSNEPIENTPFTKRQLGELYDDYINSSGFVSYNEILYRSYVIINDYRFVRRSLASQFSEILIDEFQDTNVTQYEIIKLLKNENLCSFFMVGDPNQTIMTFAGAVEDIFSKAERDFSITSELLYETFRASDNVIKEYSRLIENHPAVNNYSQYKDSQVPVVFESCVEYHCRGCSKCSTKHNLAKQYLNEILEAGVPDSDIAIIAQRWQDANNIARYLINDFNIIGNGLLPKNLNHYTKDDNFILAKAFFNFIIKSNSKNLRSLYRVIDEILKINTIDSNIVKSINKIVYLIKQIDTDASFITGLEQTQTILQDEEIFSTVDLTEIINAFGSAISESHIQNWTFSKFIQILCGDSGIKCVTAHGVKGLEFRGVILIQVDESRYPYREWDSSNFCFIEASEDSVVSGRRLLYVAMSRSMEYLAVLSSKERSRYLNS